VKLLPLGVFVLVFVLVVGNTGLFLVWSGKQQTSVIPQVKADSTGSEFGFIINSSVHTAGPGNQMSSRSSLVTTVANAPTRVYLEAVPLEHQKYKLSCEVSSLRMALLYFGIDKSEDELIEQVGYASPREMSQVGENYIWGDPDLGFVGDLDGHFPHENEDLMTDITGWGVSNGPLLRVAQKYRPGSYLKNQASVNDLQTALNKGSVVIIWHKRDDSNPKSATYVTPTGKKVQLTQNHVIPLVGYQTFSDRETEYYFNDPYFGKITKTQSQLIKEWGLQGNRMVVVV
jgi:uncharacterized protein YvpB